MDDPDFLMFSDTGAVFVEFFFLILKVELGVQSLITAVATCSLRP